MAQKNTDPNRDPSINLATAPRPLRVVRESAATKCSICHSNARKLARIYHREHAAVWYSVCVRCIRRMAKAVGLP